MNTQEAIKASLTLAREVTTMLLADLSDADLLVRPVPDANHIAWQLGHLIVSEHKMLTDAGFKMPDLPDGFAQSHDKEMATSDDASKFHKKEQYLAWMEQQRSATLALLAAVSDADLDKPTPESMHEYAATAGAVFSLIGIHEMMHAAQFVAVRRKLDKPVLI